MTELLYEIFGAWLRAGLVALSAYLIEHHIVTTSQGDRLTSELFTHVMMALPGVGAVIWTTWSKYKSRIKFLTALESAPGVSEAEVKTTISNGMGATMSMILLACALTGALAGSACASFDVNAEKLVHTAIVDSEKLCAKDATNTCTGPLKTADFRAINRDLYRVSIAGRQFTAVYRAGSATPNDWRAFLQTIDSAIAAIKGTGQGGTVGKILDGITALETKIKAVAAKAGVQL